MNRKDNPFITSSSSFFENKKLECQMQKKKKGLKTSLKKITPFPKATLSEQQDLRILHLDTEWVQGVMRINNPLEIVLDYVQQMMIWMLFCPSPKHIVQLGLGSASLTKFCYHTFPDTKITAVELNPNVIDICHTAFHLPEENNRLRIIEGDAMDYVQSQANRNHIDILQVDLYDELARAPVHDTIDFYQACANCLNPNGMMTMNIFGEDSNRFQTLEIIDHIFDAVIWLPEVHGANIVALAFKKAPAMAFSELYERAESIRTDTGLSSIRWVDGLYAWMEQQTENTD